MNRTTEFFLALNRERGSRSVAAAAPRRPSELSRWAKDAKDQLEHAAEILQGLRDLIDNANDLEENTQQIEAAVLHLKQEIFEISRRIEAIEHTRPQTPPLVNLAKSLRRGLKSISDNFNAAIKARGDKIEATVKRRRATNLIGFGSDAPSFFSTTYGGDDVEVELPAMRQDQTMVEAQRNRLDIVRNVENSVHEISKLFVQLNDLIMADDLTIQRIGENTEAALSSMETGHKALSQLYDKVKGNKCLMIEIFIVLIIAALIFLLIV
jgi:t-SNARE complex subunit (syntaxin)